MAYTKPGSGTHWQGPLWGSGSRLGGGGAGGLLEDLPADLIARRDVIWWFNDFIYTYEFDTTQWSAVTAIGGAAATGVAIEVDVGPGQLQVDAGTTNSTGCAVAFTGTGATGEFVPVGDLVALTGSAANKLIAWECRAKVDNVANGFAYFGITDSDLSTLSTAGAFAVNNGMGFRFVQSAGLQGRTANGGLGANTALSITTANDTYIRAGMRFTSTDANGAGGTGADVYINGRFTETIGTQANLPVTNLCPTFAAVNGAAALIDMRVDYFWVAYQR